MDIVIESEKNILNSMMMKQVKLERRVWMKTSEFTH